MAESIKIYRKKNKRLGFQVENVALANLYIDDQALKKLVEHMNRFYYICEDKQSECLLKGSVDPNNSIITIMSILLIVPIIKSLLFQNFEYIVWEYALILGTGIFLVLQEFRKSDQMKDKYEAAQEQRNKIIEQIAEDFNSRFSYLKMSFDFGMNENQEGFLQIKFYKDRLVHPISGSEPLAQIQPQNE